MKQALQNPVTEDGAILKLSDYCPWAEHLHDLEPEMGNVPKTMTFKQIIQKLQVYQTVLIKH